jgi:serine/threonine-protein kinase
MVGRRIGSWILDRELGHGGMGAVYEARHVTLGTRAAVKTISPGLDSTATFRERFHREANLQAQLRHPNVARVLDYVEDRGEWFLVIEYLDRGSLADRLDGGAPITQAQTLAWICQALAGLGHAHQNGIVHRDIKPANLLLTQNDEVVVADFGIARSDNAPGLTSTGVTIGTPHYMSPEQLLTPDRLDGRSDIYSIGIVLYELLAGRKPFDHRSQFEILQAHVSEPPPPLRNIQPSVAPALEAVVMRSLAKQREQRFPDCASMIRAIEQVTERPSPMPVQSQAGLTVSESRLYERAQPETASPRNDRQRGFRNRMIAGVAAAGCLCSFFAYEMAKDKVSGKQGPGEPIVVTDSTTTTASATTTTATVTHHQGSMIPPIKRPPPPVDPTPTPQPSPNPTPIQTPPQLPLIPIRENPRIAVIGIGDDLLLAGALEQEMDRRLRDGFDVADEQGEPAVNELLEAKGTKVNIQELGGALLKSDFQILVVLRVDEAARRTKTIAGIEGNFKAALMRLNAYLLPANHSIGSGWTQPAEYTELAVPVTARNAFIGPTADLRAAIQQEWANFRASRGTP